MDNEGLSGAARALEDAFFAKENARLLAEFQRQSETLGQREALRDVLEIDDDALIDHLADLGLDPETALAVTLVPLAMVAWADGVIQPRERKAILDAAAEEGIEPGSLPAKLLGSWLDAKPSAQLVDAWKRYVRAILDPLSEDERREFRDAGLGRARGIAEAAGGILGLTSKISPAERAVLDDIANVFG